VCYAALTYSNFSVVVGCYNIQTLSDFMASVLSAVLYVFSQST